MKKYLADIKEFVRKERNEEDPLEIIAILAGGTIFLHYGSPVDRKKFGERPSNSYVDGFNSLMLPKVAEIFYPDFRVEAPKEVRKEMLWGEVVAVDTERNLLKIRFGGNFPITNLSNERVKGQFDLILPADSNRIVWVDTRGDLKDADEF